MATEDIIVSISQSEETVPPQFLPIRELIHRCPDAAASMHLFMEDEEIANRNIVVIESTMNSYDWTAKHMLHVFGSHSLIQADYYLYLLDTCKVDKIFWRKVLEKVGWKKSESINSYFFPLLVEISNYQNSMTFWL